MSLTVRVNLTPQERAVDAAIKRTVQSMSLAMKDVTIAALKAKLDKPTPYMLRAQAFQARPPKMDASHQWTSRFEIAPQQSAVLRFVFFGGERTPGDAATAKRGMLRRLAQVANIGRSRAVS